MDDTRTSRLLGRSLGGRITRRDLTRGLAGLGLGVPVIGAGLTPRGVAAQGTAQDLCSEDEVELLYMTHDFDPANATNEQLIAEFQELYPNVKITWDHAPHENFEQKVLTAFAGGQGPDVFWAGDWMVPQFVENSIVGDVMPEAYGVQTSEEFAALFQPGALDAFTVDGTILTGGISEYNTFSLIYHPSHFDEAGLSLPSATEPMTWEQLAEIAGKLTKMDGDSRERSGIEWIYVTPIWTVLLFEPMLRQLGGELIDPESGEPNFASEQMIQVMQYAQDLRFKHNANDPAFLVDLLDDFANERVSMIVAGPWAFPGIAGINPRAKSAAAPLPVFEGAKRVTTLYAWSWFVNADTSNAKRCWSWSFLSFLTSKAQLWWDSAGYIQPRTDITVDGQPLADYYVETLPAMTVFNEDFPHGQYQFRSTRYFEISAAWNRAFQEIMEGADVKEVLENTNV
ncbi:MAG: extracellular solute-binding protein [Thermomicrobiales bacterium]